MSKPIIAVAFYSTYGHVAQLAESVIKGVEASGAIVKPYQFQETLSEEVLSKMHAGSSLRPKYPILKPDDLKEVDGLVIGAPTRYGRVPAQVSAFFDQCGGLWFTGALVGKFVTMFTSAAGQHGGHETTALTTIPFFVHLCFVPLGFTDPKINALDTVIGGAPWGASTVAASDGSRQPQESELAVAEHQGKFFADFVGTFVRGKQQKLVGATSGASVPVLGKVVPVNVDSEGEKEGYQVPKTDKETLTDVTPTGATPAESKDGAVTGPTEKVSQPEPGLNAAVPATAATPVPAVGPTPIASRPPQSEKKEKKGLFASCCGGRGIEN